MHVHRGQSVPRREQENEVKNCCIVWFREEPLQTGDYALPGSRISGHQEVAQVPTHLKQVFEVMSSESFHFGDIALKTAYCCLTEHWNLPKTNTSDDQGVNIM